MSDTPDEQLDQNTPWSPDELATTDVEKQADLRDIQMSLPVLEEVMDWYDEQIALYSNPETITGVNPSSDAEDVKAAVMFAQSMIKAYKYKRNEFSTRFKEYANIVLDPEE